MPANVNQQKFGKLFSQAVDGYVYAQPLYVPGVSIRARGRTTLSMWRPSTTACTRFDADSNAGANAAPLWQVSFINPGAGITAVTSGDVSCGDLIPEIGITGTPAIDLSTNTMYLVTKTKESGNFFHRLHAIDIATGAEKFGGPVAIQAQFKGNADGGKVRRLQPSA